MTNSYYNHSTYPAPNSPGSSARLRAELELVTAGFNKLPVLAGNADKLITVNSAGTALVPATAFGSVALTNSTIDNSPIGAATASTGRFTDLVVLGNAVLGSGAVIAGGSINGTIIGNTAPAAGYFTTLAASSGFTGNLTGNTTGTHTGSVTGNLTGNVTALSGTSQFNNVTINGSLDMDAGSSATIVNLPAPTNSGDAANKGYVDTQNALRLALTGGSMSGAIAMGNNKITGLADPVNAQDAATKNYVDSVAQGLDVKASVRVATTTNVILSNTQTVDGVAVTVGDRVLVKDQASSPENGVYVVAAGAWPRVTDMDAWAELPGAFVFVEQGSANDNSGWVCTVSTSGTLGVTAVTFEQFSGAGQITAGAGLTKSGNTLNVGTASTARLVVNADNIDLAASGVAAATYAGLTVDTYGRVTAALALTTLTGYGITNAYTKTETDNALALKLSLVGGTMSGAIAMGANKITGLADPTVAQDAVTLNYVTTLYGSTASAAASAAAAAISESNAANSATNASGSASAASSSASAAAASYDSFDDRYLGPKASDPSVDNDGNPLLTGALYWNTSVNQMRVYGGATWIAAYLPSTLYLALAGGTMSGAITFAGGQTWPTFNQNTTGNAATAGTAVNVSGGTASVTTLTATADSSFTSTGALLISKGTTAQQPGTPATGMMRYNSTTSQFEGYSGASPAWKSIGGSALSNDTATASNLYPVFAGATSGTAENLYTSNAQYLFKPSTGELSVKAPRASNGIVVNSATISENYTIATGDNGMSAGPVAVNSGITVTVSSGSVWTVV